MASDKKNNTAGTPRQREKTRSTNPCDCCALRRVRCEGGRPCKECQKRSLNCTTLRVAGKRGPKGPRNSTSQKVRSLQRQLQLANAAAEVDGSNGEDGNSSVQSPRPQQQHQKGDGDSMIMDGSAQSPTTPMPEIVAAPDAMSAAPPAATRRRPCGPAPKHAPLHLEAYCKFLSVFRERLYPVWPVLCCGSLITRLVSDEYDYDAWMLAASVCAGVIAQLRLPEHSQPTSNRQSSSSPRSSGSSSGEGSPESSTGVAAPAPNAPSSSRRSRKAAAITSHHFAADAAHFRECYDYRERPTLSSLLASFFLHIYCANSDLLTTAGFHLRESLTQAHMLGLHRPDTYAGLPTDERELRLRVYWVLFVSERTYCIQHGLPTILRPINQRPSPNEAPDGCSGSPISSFLYLTKLFTFLDGDLIEPPSTDMDSTALAGQSVGSDRQRSAARNKVTVFQSDLGSTEEGIGLDETQRVDIFVTRNWIRILLWEYTVRHFTMSSTADDQAFSILLPALVAHEMLGLFSAVSRKSICAHGYGMELKVFRIADCLLDVLACRRPLDSPDSMMVHSRDALHSLEKTLATVGGSESLFLNRLRHRMAEVQLPVTNTSWLQLPGLEPRQQQPQLQLQNHQHQNHHQPQPLSRRIEEAKDDTEEEQQTTAAAGSVTYLDDMGLGGDSTGNAPSAAAVFELDDAVLEQLVAGSMVGDGSLYGASPVDEFGPMNGSRAWYGMTGMNTAHMAK